MDDVIESNSAASLYKRSGNLSDSAVNFAEAAEKMAFKGDYVRALALCSKALSLDPGNALVVDMLNEMFKPLHEGGELDGEARNRYVALATQAFSAERSSKKQEAVWGQALLATLRKLPLFASIADRDVAEIVKSIKVEEFPKGHNILKQGDRGRDFCVVVSGRCAVTVALSSGGEKELRGLSDGDFFGEVSFFLDVPRTATVTALTPTEVLTFNFEDLRRLTSKSPQLAETLDRFFRERMIATVLATSDIFRGMMAPDRAAIAKLFEEVDAPKGTLLIREGIEAPGLYLIAAGEIVAYSRLGTGRVITYPSMFVGDLFGEISLLTKQPPTATCTAATDARLFMLPKRYLGEIVKRHPAVLTLMRKKAKERLDRTVHSQKKMAASGRR